MLRPADAGPAPRRARAEVPPAVRPRRSALLGALAGLIGIGCCVYPVVLVLLGLSSAAAAVDLATTLFDEWGWAFRSAGAVFALAALWVQRRRPGVFGQGSPEPHRNRPVDRRDGSGDVRGVLRPHDLARDPRGMIPSRDRARVP